MLTVSGGEVAAANGLSLGAPLTTPSGQPLLQVTNGSLTTTGSLATLGADLTLQGAFLAQSGGAVTTGADALAVGSHTLTSGPTPVFDLTGGTLTTMNDSHLVSLSGGTLTLGGPLLSLAMGPFEETPTVNISGSVLTATTSTLNPSPSGPLLTLSNGASLTAGHLLDLTNSPLDLGAQPLAALTGGSTLANPVGPVMGPVIKITGGSLTADSVVRTDGSGNTVNLSGTVLDLTNTTVTLRTLGEVPIGEGGDVLYLTLGLNQPEIRLSNSTLTVTELDQSLAGLGDITGGATPGVGLIATAGSTINVKGGVLDVVGSFQGTATEALLQLNNTTVNQTETTNALVDVDAMGVLDNTMIGPLAKISDSTIESERPGLPVPGRQPDEQHKPTLHQLSTPARSLALGISSRWPRKSPASSAWPSMARSSPTSAASTSWAARSSECGTAPRSRTPRRCPHRPPCSSSRTVPST